MAEEFSESIRYSSMPFGNRTFSADMDSITRELEDLQIKIAGRLKAAFLNNNNLKLYDKVNLYACKARGLHEYFVSLMKKFVVTSNGIANTVIPMAIEAVEMGENEGMLALFPLPITWAKEMGKEACDTKERHAEVINQLGETIGFQKYELQRNEEIRRDLNNDIIMLNTEEGEVQGKLRRMEKDKQDFSKMAAFWVGRGNACYNMMNAETQQGKEQYEVSEMDYERMGSRLKQIKKSIEEKTNDSCSMESHFTNKCMVVKYLEETLHYLEKTTKFLNKLTMFWKEIAEQLSHLITKQENGLTLLESSLEERGAGAFMRHWQKYKEDWENVTGILRYYIGNCESGAEDSINGLYSFTGVQVETTDEL